MNTTTPDKSVKWGVLFLVIAGFWAYIFFAAIHAVMPTNPITLPTGKTLGIALWFPQGWGFFSKNPREPQFRVLDLSDGSLLPAWPNNMPANLFGIKRFGRSQGIEAGLLVSMIPETSKEKCEESPYSCLKKADKTLTLNNPTPNPTICGELGFVFQEPIPWAWSSGEENIEMPSTVVRVRVACSVN
ncbi:SdpA family antimicrobial peptide system protein [Paenibacillus oleatilyticus]|uniref:SdpA family antimicrobial peptide system protein n=1 Tax=Paenibacillus oleatilyticus TaxID=2594886 RepID=UPI0020A6FEF0|nr:SdpA family antimicrobial peptide system protein [Paenibacillus oleatilyticus]